MGQIQFTSMLTCKQCGSPFPYTWTMGQVGRRPHWCSAECRKIGISQASKRRYRRRSSVSIKKLCQECGGEFTCERKSGSPTLYCSQSCRNAAHNRAERERRPSAKDSHPEGWQRKNAIQDRVCPTCGSTFRPKAPDQQFCSYPCVVQGQTFQCVCIECGEMFTGASQNAALCSAECKKRRKSHRTNWRMHRRRAPAPERFTRMEIFERDGWKCGLCGRKVDSTLRFPDPMSASLDHIIPVTLGGQHTRENTQCSHWVCNVRKNNRIPDGTQFRLLG